MARNPHLVEDGKNTRFGANGGIDAALAQKKATEKRAENKDIANLVLTKMDANKLSDVIISRARAGNIKFMELLLKLVGQMPPDKVDATVTAANPLTQMSPDELKEIYYGGKE